MKPNLKQWLGSMSGKGGLMGALLGALVSTRYHSPEDNPLKQAGKTAVFSGAGFLLGNWLEKIFRKK